MEEDTPRILQIPSVTLFVCYSYVVLLKRSIHICSITVKLNFMAFHILFILLFIEFKH